MKFFERPPADRRLLLHASFLYVTTAALCSIAPFGRVTRWLGRLGRTGIVTDESAAVTEARVLWATRTAAAVLPLRSGCLVEAVTAQTLLRRAGLSSSLRFGVARSGGDALVAHAWLEREGRTIVGGSPDRPYAELAGKDTAA